MKSYKVFKNELLKNKKVKKAYEELSPEFELVQMIIDKRVKKGLTQTQLAKKIGTKQSAISRLEKGSYNPTVAFLRNVAEALDAKLNISFSSQR